MSSEQFVFMDETGVLSNDPNQRFFALGLVKLNQTGPLFEALQKLKSKYGKSSKFEFKFNLLKKASHLPLYQELIDICLNYPRFYFSCIVVDKQHPSFQSPQSTWELQLDLAKTHIRRNIKHERHGEKAVVIADYLSKPKTSTRYFEDEVAKLPSVFNACMIESDASVFVQIVDIFIGCVVYRYRINRQNQSTTTPKAMLVTYLETKLSRAYQNHLSSSGNFKHKPDLEGGFTIFKPFYFSVYTKGEKNAVTEEV